jgi:hypothetical protein
MSLRKNKREIERLIDAFESEAGKFHDITFSTYIIRKDTPIENRRFKTPNHAIMLWQYYGKIKSDDDAKQLTQNFKESNMQWGIRDAQVSFFGLIEGQTYDLFVRMAKRAGLLFAEKEAQKIKGYVLDEIFEKTRDAQSKFIGVTNDDSLAVWLNYLLYYISQIKPGGKKLVKIDPDPYTLSLLALEHLLENLAIGKSDRSVSKIQDIKFKVALSFLGQKRAYVSKVADALRSALEDDALFYDFDYQSQLAIPNLDSLLQKIYRENSELIVVFLSAEYANKEWCGLEWRAIRDIIKSKANERIMFVRFDNAQVDGVFSIDGYIDGNRNKTRQVAKFILERVKLLSGKEATK